MARPAGLFLAVLLAFIFFLPAPCPAAGSTADQATNSTLDPDMDEGHRQFAHANYKKALEHYLKALERNENDAYLHFRIGLTYYMLDDMDKTHVNWVKSHAIDSDVAERLVFKVTGEGMSTTLIPGDVCIIDDQYYDYVKHQVGDVVHFIVPEASKKTNAKRIVSVPGDSIQIKHSLVTLNGEPIDQPYVNMIKNSWKELITNTEELSTPRNHYFILGDNRNWSYDSRYFGFVDNNSILGKVLVILESTETIGGKTQEREGRFGMIVK